MGVRQIEHMDIVPDARAVVGGVVVAEHPELLQLADGDLSNIGHEVVGYAVGILAYAPALVRADGVEVAKQRYVPGLVRGEHIAEHILDHELGPAVRIGDGQGEVLLDGDGLGLPVNGGGGGEHEVPDPALAHDEQEVHGVDEVVAEVFERLLAGLAHRLQTREMYDGIYLLFREDIAHLFEVAKVVLVEFDIPSRKLADAAHRFGFAVAKIVGDDGIEAVLDQVDDGVRTDITRATCDQYAHLSLLFVHIKCRFVILPVLPPPSPRGRSRGGDAPSFGPV